MNYILLGPPCAGKGTQAKKIAKYFDITHLSTGDMLRKAQKSSKMLNKFLSFGWLVPDKIVINIIKKFLEKDYIKKGFVFDGFPRTIKQAEELDVILESKNLKIDMVFLINICFEEIIKRIAKRKICKCGRSYNVIDKCDFCGRKLVQRNDDKEDIVKKRFDIYEKQTKPLVGYYSKSGLLVDVDGSKDEKSIFEYMKGYIK
jgi:adenylate kinase